MYIDKIRTDLLQCHLDGKLTSPTDVMSIVHKHQPAYGLNICEWELVTSFILEIENSNNIPDAAKIAEKYGLELNV